MYILGTAFFIWLCYKFARLVTILFTRFFGPPFFKMTVDKLHRPQWHKPQRGRRYWLYLLKCGRKKYYVGITRNLSKRRDEEWSQGDRCPKWLKIHCPKSYVGVYRLRTRSKRKAEKIETKFTKDLWQVYGKSNIRGGRYCSTKRYR